MNKEERLLDIAIIIGTIIMIKGIFIWLEVFSLIGTQY